MTAADNDKPLLDFDAVRSMATGRWPSILADLGIEVRTDGKHGPCPGCAGTDRHRFDDRDGRGTFICSQGCGDNLAGDGFALIQHVRGCGALEAFEAVADVLGSDTLRKQRSERNRQPQRTAKAAHVRDTGKRTYALEIWLRAIRDDAIVAKHPYVQRKAFGAAHGAGVASDVRSGLWEGPQRCLVVPVRANGTGRVIAVQAINAEGTKVTFGSMTAEDGTPGYLVLGNDLDPEAARYACEGWATGIAIVFTMLRGNAACAISFGKSRLDAVAEQFQRDAPPGREVIIAEDRS